MGSPLLGLPIFLRKRKRSVSCARQQQQRGACLRNARIFGFEKLATYIEDTKPDLVIDAGDLYHGQAFATMEEGESMAELVKAVGYDLLTPGNHDWNYGKDRLKELGELSDV